MLQGLKTVGALEYGYAFGASGLCCFCRGVRILAKLLQASSGLRRLGPKPLTLNRLDLNYDHSPILQGP